MRQEQLSHSDNRKAINSLLIGLGSGTLLKEAARAVVPFEMLEGRCIQNVAEQLCSLISNDAGPNIPQAFIYTLAISLARDFYFRSKHPSKNERVYLTALTVLFITIQIILSESRPYFTGGEINYPDIHAEMLGMIGGVLFYIALLSGPVNNSSEDSE